MYACMCVSYIGICSTHCLYYGYTNSQYIDVRDRHANVDFTTDYHGNDVYIHYTIV